MTRVGSISAELKVARDQVLVQSPFSALSLA